MKSQISLSLSPLTPSHPPSLFLSLSLKTGRCCAFYNILGSQDEICTNLLKRNWFGIGLDADEFIVRDWNDTRRCYDTLMGCSLSLVSNGRRRVTKQNEDRHLAPQQWETAMAPLHYRYLLAEMGGFHSNVVRCHRCINANVFIIVPSRNL